MRKESIGKLLLTLMTALVMVLGVFAGAVYTNTTPLVAPGQPIAASELEEGAREIGDEPISAIGGTKAEEPEIDDVIPKYMDVDQDYLQERKAEKEAALAQMEGRNEQDTKTAATGGSIGGTGSNVDPIAIAHPDVLAEYHGTRAAVPTADPNGPYSGDEGDMIPFTGSATNGPILEWDWDFGDPALGSSSLQNPSYAFGDNGVYTVGLRARNADGWGAFATTTATIYNVAPYNVQIKDEKGAAEIFVYEEPSNDGTAMWPPFQDAWGYPMRVQCLYFADQMDPRFLGKEIIDMKLQLAYWRSSQSGTWQYMRLWVTNTNLASLSTNLNTNYNRPLGERVANYPGPYTYNQNYGPRSSSWDMSANWHKIDFNENFFTWDGTSNVLIDIEVGDQISGNDISTDGTYATSVTSWVFGRSNNPNAYFSDSWQYSLRMGYVDPDPTYYEGDDTTLTALFEDPAIHLNHPTIMYGGFRTVYFPYIAFYNMIYYSGWRADNARIWANSAHWAADDEGPIHMTAVKDLSGHDTYYNNWRNYFLGYYSNSWHQVSVSRIVGGPNTLTRAALDAHAPDVIYIGDAWSNAQLYTWTEAEQNILLKYCSETGAGIIADTGTLDPSYAPLNSNWAPYFGMNTVAWPRYGSRNYFDADIPSHRIWQGLSDPEYAYSRYYYQSYNNRPNGALQIAHQRYYSTHYNDELIMAYEVPEPAPYGDYFNYEWTIDRYIGNPPSMPLVHDPNHPQACMETVLIETDDPTLGFNFPCYGDYLIQLRVIDDDGGVGVSQKFLLAMNHPPSLEITNPAPATAPIYSWNLDPPANNAGWSVMEWGPYAWYHTQDWQFGMPGIGAASPPYAYGTRLTSSYTTYGLDHLRSPTVTIPTGQAYLEFDAAWQYENYYDGWQVCFYDGLSYTLLEPAGGYPQAYTYAIAMHGWYHQGAFSQSSSGYPAYTPMSFDLSSIGGMTGRIVFLHCTDYSVNYNGLFVDNVRISAPLPYALRNEGEPIEFAADVSDIGSCPLDLEWEYCIDPYTGLPYECITPQPLPGEMFLANEKAGGNYWPFASAFGNSIRFQMLYPVELLGGLGDITNFAWRHYWAASCTVGNFRVYMIDTDVDQLGLDLDANYGSGTPTLVKQVPSFAFGGAEDAWSAFDINPYSLTPGRSLLVEIRWSGFSGSWAPVWMDYGATTSKAVRTWVWDHNGNDGVMADNWMYATRFDGIFYKIAIYDDGLYDATATVSDGANLYGMRYGNDGFQSDSIQTLIQNLPPEQTLEADPHMMLEENEHRDILHDDVEGGGNIAWEATGLWHVIDTAAWPSAPPPRANSGTHAWYCGRDYYWDYNAGTVSASLRTPVFILEGVQWNLFEFYYWMEVQEGGTYYDYFEVSISVNGGSWQVLLLQGDSTSMWRHEAVYLDNYASPGDTVQVQFYFNTRDSIANSGEGVYIDDVKLTSFGFLDAIYFTDVPIVFHDLVRDLGSDDVQLTWDFGPGVPLITTTYYNYDMPGGNLFPSQGKPDPFPSPCPPASLMDLTEVHSICESGEYGLDVTAEDDDGGVTAASLVIPVKDILKVVDVTYGPQMHHVDYTLIDGGQDHDDGFPTVLADVDDIGVGQMDYDDFSYFMMEVGVAHIGGEGSPDVTLWEDAMTLNFPTDDFVYEFLFSPGDLSYGEVGYFVVVIGVPSKGWSQELYDMWDANMGFLPFEYDIKFESQGPGVCGAHEAKVQVDHVRDGEKHKWWEWEFRRSQAAMLAILELDWNIDMNVGPATYDLTQIKWFDEYSARYYWLDWGTAVPKEAVLYMMVYLFTIYVYTDVDNMGVPQDPIVAIGHELGVQGALPVGHTDTRTYAGGTLVLDGPGRTEWHVGAAYMQLPSGNDLKIVMVLITEEVTAYYFYALVTITKFGRPVAEYLVFGMGILP